MALPKELARIPAAQRKEIELFVFDELPSLHSIAESKNIERMKGYVLDQGSNPTHTYIKTYDQVLQLVRKKHDAISITQVLGRRMNTVRQYLTLVRNFHPELEVDVPDGQKNQGSKNQEKTPMDKCPNGR